MTDYKTAYERLRALAEAVRFAAPGDLAPYNALCVELDEAEVPKSAHADGVVITWVPPPPVVGARIRACITLRNVTNLGLKEAKEAVEGGRYVASNAEEANAIRAAMLGCVTFTN